MPQDTKYYSADTLSTPGVAQLDALQVELSAAVAPKTAAVLSLDNDCTLAGREPGQELMVVYSDNLTAGEVSAAASAVAVHDHTAPGPWHHPVMEIVADHDLDEPDHECHVDASVAMITLTLPQFASAPAHPFMAKVVGASGMTVVPHPSDVGITIDGGAILVVSDGGAVRIGANTSGEWSNMA